MKTQFGELVTGDFEDNTLTIEIDGEMELQAGRYALVPIEDYNKLVSGSSTSDEALHIGSVVGRSEQFYCFDSSKDGGHKPKCEDQCDYCRRICPQ